MPDVTLCQCAVSLLQVCVSVYASHCVTGPVPVCLQVSDMTYVSVFTCLCITGLVSVYLHVCATRPVSVC